MFRSAALVLALPLLAACQPGTPAPEVNRADRAEVPLASVPGAACWRTDRIPTLTTTLYEDGPDGAQVAREVVLRPAEDRLFAVPCPDQMDEGFTASLQRALAARGLYAGGISGAWNAETGAAVRRFQAPLGLDSTVLSLDAAQRLGLVAIPRDAL